MVFYFILSYNAKIQTYAIAEQDEKMNLFMIYVGGKHKDSLIELHDIRFVAADSIEATYETLHFPALIFSKLNHKFYTIDNDF